MASFGHAACSVWVPMARRSRSKPRAVDAGGLLMAPFAAALAALLFGGFVVRLSGVYLAMLTLAFAQIVWRRCFRRSRSPARQWRARRLAGFLGQRSSVFYWLTLALCVRAYCCCAVPVRAVRLRVARHARFSVTRWCDRTERRIVATARS